ncbi:MAG: hypothetical protein KGH69_04770 [Candidatus Micrarchaeota archaeon]|nr:hypothetical protein [Candidatus Micrarchaeota archaeon]
MERKLQSAMEYLMTYGWAILAIAIVMVSLYSLGIFNASNLKPTANPGACEVVRTAAQVSLAGQCTGMVPKYVGQFGGSTSYIQTASSVFKKSNGVYSVCLWAYGSFPHGYNAFMGQNNNPRIQVLSSGQIVTDLYVPGDVNFWSSSNIPKNTWSLVCTIINTTTTTPAVTYYINSKNAGTSTQSGTNAYSSSQATIAMPALNVGSNAWTGYLSNVQIYNASLDNATVEALYLEGIGGVPVDAQHLVGWWPLNGNANDYSGNNNQGNAVNVTWNANWQPGYAAPTS